MTSTATSPSYAGAQVPAADVPVAAVPVAVPVSVVPSGAADLTAAVAQLRHTLETELANARDGLEKAAAALVNDLTTRLNGTQSLLTAGIGTLEQAAQDALTKL